MTSKKEKIKKQAQPLQEAEQEKQQSTTGADVVATEQVDTSQTSQISELQNLTTSLMETVKNMQTQTARDMAYFEALADIKSATKALLVPRTNPDVPGQNSKDCHDPCGCVSDSCCTYDIILTEIRVSSMQNEPSDSSMGSMEVRVFAHIDGIGAVIPGMFSTLTLHKPMGNPALWTTINAKVAQVSVPNSGTKSFLIKVDGKEVEHTQFENLTFQRDEHGANSGSISLNCCCKPPEITVEIPFTAGGLALGNRGSIEARFSAVKKCC